MVGNRRFDGVRPLAVPYQNSIDRDLAGWRTAYDDADFPRLVEVKARRDPDAKRRRGALDRRAAGGDELRGSRDGEDALEATTGGRR
jgi:hypothetical protein